MKKLISLALVMSLILSLAGGAFAATGNPLGAKKFTDVSEGAWYYPYVDRLTKEGTVTGTSPSGDKFSPALNVSRCEFVTMVIRSTIGDLPKPANEYHWAQRYMEKAYALGITTAEESPRDIWGDPILRQDMAKIIARCTELIMGEKPYENAEQFIPKIADYDSICTVCKPFVLQVYAKGILSGVDGKGTFNGTGKTTRGEATCVIVKLIDLTYRTERYDGVSFTPALDVNENGTMKIEAAERFIMKALENTRFTKENGKYYISCTYPELPEGFEVFYSVGVEFTSGSYYQAKTNALKESALIPNNGSFKKEITGMSSLSNVSYAFVSIAIEAPTATTTDYKKDTCTAKVMANYSGGKLTEFSPWLIYTDGGYKDITLTYSDIFKW